MRFVLSCTQLPGVLSIECKEKEIFYLIFSYDRVVHNELGNLLLLLAIEKRLKAYPFQFISYEFINSLNVYKL